VSYIISYIQVYVHLDGHYTRGSSIANYNRGSCVFLGVGEAMCSRLQMFQLSHGLAIRMMPPQSTNDCYHPPSIPHTLCEGKFILQNLPSIVTTHALLEDVIHGAEMNSRTTNYNTSLAILDMCCAPGGKTSHIASLLKRTYSSNFLVVACDKSQKKISEMKIFLRKMNATTHVVPLALDSTSLLILPNDNSSVTNISTYRWPSVYEVRFTYAIKVPMILSFFFPT
jgi:hypothetical protein